LSRQCDFLPARNYYLKALSKTEDKNQQALMKNNIAYIDAVSGDATLLQEADTYSQEAMAILSWYPIIKGTRGTVLLELNRLDEAILLLTDALRLSSESDGKAQNCCFLAIAEAMRGNVSKGNQYLQEARKLDPDCFLLKRAEEALAVTPSASPQNISGPTDLKFVPRDQR
jgi:tetratricopeptide (TPR) repeat protein